MKKYILSVAFLFAVLITPMAQVQAAGLTPVQISAIIGLLQAFGADQSVINSVQTTLNGGATTQPSQSTYPSGCTSLVGYSTTTSLRCDGTTPDQNSGGNIISVANLVVSVSNSASGPFTTNGTVLNNLPVYARITSAGVNIKNSSPKGCIQPTSQTGCLSDLGYRDYIPSEWLDNSTIQTIVQDPSVYPLTTYELYIKFPGGSPIKAGTLKLVVPTTTKTSTVAGCAPGAVFSATTSHRCDGTTPAAVNLSAVHLTSISFSSLIVETVGTTATIYGSGFAGTNSIYVNGVLIDPATIGSSGGLTPTWISFVVPSHLPSCPGSDRLCVPGPALTPGTYTVRVQDINGTSNSINFIVFSIDGNGNGSPSGPGVGGGTGIGGALGTVIGTLTDAMAALSAAISGTPSLADTNVALANAMSNAEVALSEAHDSMSAANVSAAADAVSAAATAAADAGIASGIAANADAAAATAADAAAAIGLGTAANSPDSGVSPGDSPGAPGGGDSPGSAVGTW